MFNIEVKLRGICYFYESLKKNIAYIYIVHDKRSLENVQK